MNYLPTQSYVPLTLDEIENIEKQITEAPPNTIFKYKRIGQNKFTLVIEKVISKPINQIEEVFQDQIYGLLETPIKINPSCKVFGTDSYLQNFCNLSNHGQILNFDQFNNQNQSAMDIQEQGQINNTYQNQNIKNQKPNPKPKNFIKNLLNCFTRFIYLFGNEEIVKKMADCQLNKRRMQTNSLRVYNHVKIELRKSSNQKLNQFYSMIQKYQNPSKIKFYNKEAIDEMIHNKFGQLVFQYWLRYFCGYCLDNFSEITTNSLFSHTLAAVTLLEYIQNKDIQQLKFSAKQYMRKQLQMKSQNKIFFIDKPLQIFEDFQIQIKKTKEKQKQIKSKQIKLKQSRFKQKRLDVKNRTPVSENKILDPPSPCIDNLANCIGQQLEFKFLC